MRFNCTLGRKPCGGILLVEEGGESNRYPSPDFFGGINPRTAPACHPPEFPKDLRNLWKST